MIEGADCQTFRVQLVRLTLGFLPGRLWGKWVKVAGPTYYDADDLRRRLGADLWGVDLWAACRNTRYEIWGQREGEANWLPLSRALVAEDRLAEKIAAAIRAEVPKVAIEEIDAASGPPDLAERAAEQLREVIERSIPAPGRGEAAYHLLDHREMRRDEALRALRKIEGWGDISRDDLKRLRNEGKRRLEKPENWCRFCSIASPRQIESP